ncbi:MAG: lipid A biosynthesis acyltransferase [Pseudomonadota bacterium]|nr:lipid A biosynthesis acyltransferase [Pseudomonadota bacterium]
MIEPASFRVRLTQTLMRVLGLLPLRALHVLGYAVGALLRLFNTREYLVARRNVDLCYAHLDARQRSAFVRDSLAQTAMGLTELPRVWGVAPHSALAQIKEIRGGELLRAAIARQRGVIVAAPHLGQWELLNLYLSTQGPMALLYRQPQHPAWEPLLLACRGVLGATQVRADAAGVRVLYRCLRHKMIVGVLPDQRPKGGEGEFAPFFGVPCKSMTLLSRLARKTDATVVFGFVERLSSGSGFCLHFLPAPEGIADEDLVLAVGALHQGLEHCVRVAPLQYQWTYKRFSIQPGVEGDEMYPDCR